MPQENTQYIINGMIVFNVLDNTLWVKNNSEDMLSLGLVPGRLFRYLLANAGRVVSKDELLSSVWDDYGLRSSGHSLNQNISLLRKSLTLLGCESDVISTLPRLGYLIKNDSVEVLSCAERKHDIPEKSYKTEGDKIKFSLRLFLAGCMLLVMLILVTLFLNKNRHHAVSLIPVQSLQPVENDKGCSIFTTKPRGGAHEKLYEIALNLVPDSLSSCSDNVFYIIAADDSVILSGSSGRVFLTYCLLDLKTQLISGCETIYDRTYMKKN